MGPKGFHRKLTVILSTDVKGYGQLMGEDEEWTVRTLYTYQGVIACQKKNSLIRAR
jgi:hypothetical protein